MEPEIKGYKFITNEDLERLADEDGLLVVGSKDPNPNKTLAQHYAKRFNVSVDKILVTDSTSMPHGKSIYKKLD